MAEVELRVRNPSGLHARPAATFVKAAAAFRSAIQVTNLSRDPGRSASAKSVLGVMGLGVSRGHALRIVAAGEDEDEVIRTLSQLVEAGLGEPLVPDDAA